LITLIMYVNCVYPLVRCVPQKSFVLNVSQELILSEFLLVLAKMVIMKIQIKFVKNVMKNVLNAHRQVYAFNVKLDFKEPC